MRIDDFLSDVPKVSLVRHKGMIKLQVYFSREERKYFSTGIAISEKKLARWFGRWDSRCGSAECTTTEKSR